jgi:hypothetical protein
MNFEASLGVLRIGSKSVDLFFGIDLQQFMIGVGYKPGVQTHECEHCSILSDIIDICIGPFIFGLEFNIETKK